jgi:hypothetical protein
VTHALHKLAQIRPGSGDKEIPGMTQVMKMNAAQACGGQRGQPNPRRPQARQLGPGHELGTGRYKEPGPAANRPV